MKPISRTHPSWVRARLALLASACMFIPFGGAFYVLSLTNYAGTLFGDPTLTLNAATVGVGLGMMMAFQFVSPSLPSLAPTLCIQALVCLCSAPFLYLVATDPWLGYLALGGFAASTGWTLGWVYRTLIRFAPVLAPPAGIAGLGVGALVSAVALPLGPYAHQALGVWFLSLSALYFTFQIEGDRKLWTLLAGMLMLLTLFQMSWAPHLQAALESLRTRMLPL